jgi:hypothetical protein
MPCIVHEKIGFTVTSSRFYRDCKNPTTVILLACRRSYLYFCLWWSHRDSRSSDVKARTGNTFMTKRVHMYKVTTCNHITIIDNPLCKFAIVAWIFMLFQVFRYLRDGKPFLAYWLWNKILTLIPSAIFLLVYSGFPNILKPVGEQTWILRFKS